MFLLYFSESRGQYVVTQTPTVKAVVPGQTVSLNCKTSSNVYNNEPGTTRNLEELLNSLFTMLQHFSLGLHLDSVVVDLGVTSL